MPSEAQINNLAICELYDKGFYYWIAPRGEFKKHIDIFGVFDIIAFKGKYFKFIQVTSLPNHAARRKKVQEFIDRTGFAGWSEVWSWDKKNKRFRIEKIS